MGGSAGTAKSEVRLRIPIRRTVGVAMSRTTGGPSVGAAHAIGFVPIAGFLDRVGVQTGDVFVIDIPIMPWALAIIAYHPAIP